MFCLKKYFLKYNWHEINCTYLKHTIWNHQYLNFPYVKYAIGNHISDNEHFHHPQNLLRTFVIPSHYPSVLPPLLLHELLTTSYFLKFYINEVKHCVLFGCLAYIQPSYLAICLYGCIYQYLIPFKCWAMFQCRNH